jgi:hypothetical protein
VKYFNLSSGSFVRSFTLSIKTVRPELLIDAPRFYVYLEDKEELIKICRNQASEWIWGLLRGIPAKVASIVGLMSFLLYMSPEGFLNFYWLPRPIIATIVEALPESCVSLEIESRGADYVKLGSAHLCDAVRVILPRLRNLRLRLSTLCPALFGTGFDHSSPGKFFTNFQPVAALSLQTLVINYVAGSIFGARANIYGASRESLYANYSD